MTTLPTYGVTEAVRALRHFGALKRDTAERLLKTWAHVDELSKAQRREVLTHFPELKP